MATPTDESLPQINSTTDLIEEADCQTVKTIEEERLMITASSPLLKNVNENI